MLRLEGCRRIFLIADLLGLHLGPTGSEYGTTSAPAPVGPTRRCAGSGKGGQRWHMPACPPRPRGPATTRRQADWQGCRTATCSCLWWGAAGAVGWRWPADGWQPAASWCPSLPAGGAGCLGAEADLVSWSVPSGTPPDGDRPSLDGAVPFVAASQRRTSRTPRQARLTETTECWARRRRHGAGGGTEGD